MAYTYDNEVSARRIAAYTAFLLDAYGTDVNGLADIAGIDRGEMAEYVHEADAEKLNATIIQKLGQLTGISFSWLFAEGVA